MGRFFWRLGLLGMACLLVAVAVPAEASDCGNDTVDSGEECDGGTCCSASCTFKPVGEVCRAATDECDAIERCTGTATCASDQPKAQGAECRMSADGCDAAEVCNGTDFSCPSDQWHPEGFVCRPAAQPDSDEPTPAQTCDVAEVCPAGAGPGNGCPADSFVAAGEVCRAAIDATTSTIVSIVDVKFATRSSAVIADRFCVGENSACAMDSECDSEERDSCRLLADGGAACVGEGYGEYCSTDADCFRDPDPNPEASDDGDLCRSLHPSEVPISALKLDGFSIAPLSVAISNSTSWDQLVTALDSEPGVSAAFVPRESGVSANECVADPNCEAVVEIRSDTVGNAGSLEMVSDPTVLGFQTSEGFGPVCDIAEVCSGADALCPVDSVQDASTVCRAPGDSEGVDASCDVPEHCPGLAGRFCPHQDDFKAENVSCGDTSDTFCTDPDKCNSEGSCRPNHESAGTVCRVAIEGGCDQTEFCDADGACPADDNSGNVGRVCRSSRGDCDIEEACNGLKTCPPDAVEPATTICRLALNDDCDREEACGGDLGDFECPEDELEEDGTVCDDALNCTEDDRCLAGLCEGVAIDCGDGELQYFCSVGAGETIVEECDDGNILSGDGCSEFCRIEQGFVCPESPATTCKQSAIPGRSHLKIRDIERVNGLSLTWVWRNGVATDASEFGDPTALGGMDYTLCLYDQGGLLARAVAPAGGDCGIKNKRDCWRTAGSKSFKYLDSRASIEPSGVKRIELKAGRTGRARLSFRAVGGMFPFPSNGGFRDLANLTEVTGPVTVQLHGSISLGSSEVCFESTFHEPFDKDEEQKLFDKEDG